ncbi:ABC transporter substrate-binding protein [Methanolobus halotolerans]|uniref:Sulfonate ABC transporter substrate-binding protein n=1 Tax=Methanolobus halotolerans TaxID=2052935 RepID=A0A4E0R1A6_9EURY|nr:aliphatic sulfonate ABC transporter substrate-binding protein [Methanolobus halotolerans]TGC10939.1 sulfonate ABC transporter substrate-binding protein [Methanolobus halotolerans]
MNRIKSLRSSTFLILILFLVAAVLVSGCTDQATEDEPVTELTFGYQPSTHQIAYLAAESNGWWSDDLGPLGVERIRDNVFPTGAPEMQAMLSGEIDVAYVGAAPVVSAISSGLDAKIVAAAQIQGSDIVLRNELPYDSPDDLRGLRIATFPPGTIQDTLLREWLEANDIDPENDVTIVPMGPGDAMTAISANQVNAVFLPHPAPTLIEEEGVGRSVVSSGEIQDDHACCVVAVSGKLIREHPEIVQQIVETHVRATEYTVENPEDAAQIFADDQDWDVEVVRQSITDWDGVWVADPNLIVNSTVDYAQVQYELGYISMPLEQEDLFDLSFYEALDQ